MAEKHLVCQGAICMCQFGTLPDKLRVLSHQKEYINDPQGSEKLIASTREIGAATLQNNTFGVCNFGWPPKPCKPAITEWQGFYRDITLSNGGNPLLEDSTATCAVGTPGCISIVFHGQISVPCAQSEANANDDVLSEIYPFGDLKADTRVLCPLPWSDKASIIDAYWIDEDDKRQRELITDSPVTLYIELMNFTSGVKANFHFENQDDKGKSVNYSGIVGENGIVKIEDFQLKSNSNGQI